MQLQQGQRRLLQQQRGDEGDSGCLMRLEDGNAGAGEGPRRDRHGSGNRALSVSSILQPSPLESRFVYASSQNLLQPASSALGSTWIRRFLLPGPYPEANSQVARDAVGRKRSAAGPHPNTASLSAGLQTQNAGMAEGWVVVKSQEKGIAVASGSGPSFQGEEFSQEWGHRRKVTTAFSHGKRSIQSLHPTEATLSTHPRIYIAHGKASQERQLSIEGSCAGAPLSRQGEPREGGRSSPVVRGFGPFKMQMKVPVAGIPMETGMDPKLKSPIVEEDMDARVNLTSQSQGCVMAHHHQGGTSQVPGMDERSYLTLRTAVLESRERRWTTAYEFARGSRFRMIGHEEVIQESVRQMDHCGEVEAGASLERSEGVHFGRTAPPADKYSWQAREYVDGKDVGAEGTRALDPRIAGEGSGSVVRYPDMSMAENPEMAVGYMHHSHGVMDLGAMVSPEAARQYGAPLRSYGCPPAGERGQALLFNPCLGVVEETESEDTGNSSRVAQPTNSLPISIYGAHASVDDGRDDLRGNSRQKGAFLLNGGHRHGDAALPTSSTSELALALHNKLRYTPASANQSLDDSPATRSAQVSSGTKDDRYHRVIPGHISSELDAPGYGSAYGLDPGRFAYDQRADGKRLETPNDVRQVYGSPTSSRRFAQQFTSGGHGNYSNNASPSSRPSWYRNGPDLDTPGRSREQVDAQRIRAGQPGTAEIVSEMQVRRQDWETLYQVSGSGRSDIRGMGPTHGSPHILHAARGDARTSGPSGQSLERSRKLVSETAACGHGGNDMGRSSGWLQRWAAPPSASSSSSHTHFGPSHDLRTDTPADPSRRGIGHKGLMGFPAPRDLQLRTADGSSSSRAEGAFSASENLMRDVSLQGELKYHPLPSAAAMALVSTATLKSGPLPTERFGAFSVWPAAPMHHVEDQDCHSSS